MQARDNATFQDGIDLVRFNMEFSAFEAFLRQQLAQRDISEVLKAYNLLQDQELRLSQGRLFASGNRAAQLEALFLLRILSRLEMLAEEQEIDRDVYFELPDADEVLLQRQLDIELAIKSEIEFATNVALGLDYNHEIIQLGATLNKLPRDVVETVVGASYKTAITGQTVAWQLGFSDKWLLNVASPVSFGFGIGAALFSALNTLIVPSLYLYYKAQGYNVHVSGMSKARVAVSAAITTLTIIGLAFPLAAPAVLIGFGVVSLLGNAIEMLDHGLKRENHPRLLQESQERQHVLSAEINEISQAIDCAHDRLCACFKSNTPQVREADAIKDELIDLRHRFLFADDKLFNERAAYRELQKTSLVARSNLQTTMTAIDVAVGAAILVGSLLAAFPLTAPAGVLCVTVAVGVGVATFIARKVQQAWAHRKSQRAVEAVADEQHDDGVQSSSRIYQQLGSVPDLRRDSSPNFSLDDTQSEARPLLQSDKLKVSEEGSCEESSGSDLDAYNACRI